MITPPSPFPWWNSTHKSSISVLREQCVTRESNKLAENMGIQYSANVPLITKERVRMNATPSINSRGNQHRIARKREDS